MQFWPGITRSHLWPCSPASSCAVEHYRGVPPYAETRLYVRRILTAMGGQRTQPFDPAVTAPSGLLALLRQPARLR